MTRAWVGIASIEKQSQKNKNMTLKQTPEKVMEQTVVICGAQLDLSKQQA